MFTARSSHWWLGRFAARLLQLDPRAGSLFAISQAVDSYHLAGDCDPDITAYHFYRNRRNAMKVQSPRDDRPA